MRNQKRFRWMPWLAVLGIVPWLASCGGGVDDGVNTQTASQENIRVDGQTINPSQDINTQGPAVGADQPSRQSSGYAPGQLHTLEWTELLPEEEKGIAKQVVDHTGLGVTDILPRSSNTVGGLDGIKAKIPGFIVPVELADNNLVKEFFLVPYFGACIHVPPPPPNQIIYARLATPEDLSNIYDAYWISGTLRVEDVVNDVAASAYVMEVEAVELFTDF